MRHWPRGSLAGIYSSSAKLLSSLTPLSQPLPGRCHCSQDAAVPCCQGDVAVRLGGSCYTYRRGTLTLGATAGGEKKRKGDS